MLVCNGEIVGHVCRYCGSLDGDSFMALARGGATKFVPTDKPYKTYFEPVPEEFEERNPAGKFYFAHLSEEQRREFQTLLALGSLKLAYPGFFYVRPFFIP